jgi:Amt family ammonium transporter
VPSSLVIGIVAGVLVVVGVLAFDKLKIDDPVGALSVHLLNGVFGTLAVGLFADSSAAPVAGPPNGLFAGGGFGPFVTQLTGVLAAGGYAFVVSLLAFGLIRVTMGLRVTPEEEIDGLDVGEHGMTAYPDFVLHTEGGYTAMVNGRGPTPSAATVRTPVPA